MLCATPAQLPVRQRARDQRLGPPPDPNADSTNPLINTMAQLRGRDGPTVRAPGPDDVDVGRGEDRIEGGGEVGVQVPD